MFTKLFLTQKRNEGHSDLVMKGRNCSLGHGVKKKKKLQAAHPSLGAS